MSERYADLERLHRLKESGALTEEEFLREKERLLVAAPALVPAPERADLFWGMDRNTYATLLHLSQFAGYALPLAGWVLPIVMWVVAKDRDALIDRHGRIVLNWTLSTLLYGMIFGVLCFVLIGIPLLIALFVCGVVFAIIGAVRAGEGVAWRYPLSIPFLRVAPDDGQL